jgi:hypothetical protein
MPARPARPRHSRSSVLHRQLVAAEEEHVAVPAMKMSRIGPQLEILQHWQTATPRTTSAAVFAAVAVVAAAC